MTTPAERRSILLSSALVLLVTAWAYSPVLGNGYTNWDDHRYLTDSPLARELTAASLRTMLTTFQMGNYHPLTLLSYSLEYRFFGLEPSVSHGINLLFHLGNSLLAFLLLRGLFGGLTVPLTGSLLFGVHPIHVESVAWISERKDVLSVFFGLGTLASWLAYRRSGHRRRYLLALFLFVMALLSKAMVVTIPVVMLLIDRRLGRVFDRRNFRELAPFFSLSAVFGVLAVMAQQGAMRRGDIFPFWDNFFVACHGLVFYLRKTLLPLDLSNFYPYPLKTGRLLPLPYLLSPLAVLLLAVVVTPLARRSRDVSFGLLFFLITVAPVLQLIPLGSITAADRYLYLPSLSLFCLAGLGVRRLSEAAGGRGVAARSVPWILLAVIVVFLSRLTWQRTFVWADSLTLWSDAIAKHPGASPIPYLNRGKYYQEREDYDRALADFSRARQIKPDFEVTNLHLGLAYLGKGEFRRAADNLGIYLAKYPDDAEGYLDRGFARWALGDRAGAVADYREYRRYGAAGTAPRAADAALEEDAAIRYSVMQAERKAKSVDAYNRGTVLLDRDKADEAEALFRRALEFDPANADAHLNLGTLLSERGRLEEALVQYREAIELNPEDADARYNLGLDLRALGRGAEAEAQFREVLRLRPGHEGARAALGGKANRRALAGGKEP